MKDYVERLNVQERDSVTYRDVVSLNTILNHSMLNKLSQYF